MEMSSSVRDDSVDSQELNHGVAASTIQKETTTLSVAAYEDHNNYEETGSGAGNAKHTPSGSSTRNRP